MSAPTTASWRDRPIPTWYDDAKLGIFVHWGVYSVPAWAPTGPIWDADPNAPKAPRFADNPYAEWYRNTMAIEGSPTQRHHARTFGADFAYERFADDFNREVVDWDPASWAELFEAAGAGYAVLTTKHHDGFLLWPSAHRNPKAPDYVASRDLVGELTDAVRGRGLRMGLYYSGGIDWLWHDQRIESFGDFLRAIPPDPAYARYATDHWKELIDRYAPCAMWNDIGFPGDVANIEALFDHYYARVPDGVVNDRFRMTLGPDGLASALPHDVRTPEYTAVADISAKKFESVRGIGHSFGYNRNEGEGDYLSADQLVQTFVDVVSKNGNLLINVGPRPDGAIPHIQEQRLRALGRWLAVAGEAVYRTRPWRRAEATTADGRGVRFTRGAEAVYAIVFDPALNHDVEIPLAEAAAVESVRVLGSPAAPQWSNEGGRLRVELPKRPPTEGAVALALGGAL